MAREDMGISARTYAHAHAVRGRRAAGGRATARGRVYRALKRHGLLVATARPVVGRGPPTYQSAPGGPVRWRSAVCGVHCGIVRLAHKRMRRRVAGRGLATHVQVRTAWRWLLAHQRPRPHPDVWFLCIPPGGVLVVPDRVLQPAWQEIMVTPPGGYWLWQFWERWDVCATFPDLPDDLACGTAAPDAAAILARCRRKPVRPSLARWTGAMHVRECRTWQQAMVRVGWSPELLASV